MPLQNRVDPFGAIHAVEEYGTLMGNRGIIHDPETKTLLNRRWASRAWIICLTDFGGRHRTVMSRSSYTELFFLDEATALAAGHRPCFECQRQHARAFADAFAAGLGRDSIKASEIDAVLHHERLAAGGKPHPLDQAALAALPDGAMVSAGGQAYLVRHGSALPWSFAGYGAAVPIARLGNEMPMLITPPSTIAALRHGFRPRFAPGPA